MVTGYNSNCGCPGWIPMFMVARQLLINSKNTCLLVSGKTINQSKKILLILNSLVVIDTGYQESTQDRLTIYKP